jgi:hypothetical protein
MRADPYQKVVERETNVISHPESDILKRERIWFCKGVNVESASAATQVSLCLAHSPLQINKHTVARGRHKHMSCGGSFFQRENEPVIAISCFKLQRGVFLELLNQTGYASNPFCFGVSFKIHCGTEQII